MANLFMHLDINLPLLSELEHLCRAFWKNYNQNHSHNQDKAAVPHEQRCSEPNGQSPSPKVCSDNADSHTESNQSHGQNSLPKSDLNSEQLTDENHYTVKTGSQGTNQFCCKSVSVDIDNSEWETHKDCDLAAQHKPLQPLQVKSPLLSKSSISNKTSKVPWDRSTEESS